LLYGNSDVFSDAIPLDFLFNKESLYWCRSNQTTYEIYTLHYWGIINILVQSVGSCREIGNDYAYKSNWNVNTINALGIDSAYGSSERLNSYQQGEKRVNYYFKSIDITFEVSGEGAVNPDFIVGVWDGKHF
jgi:hypothetical protein